MDVEIFGHHKRVCILLLSSVNKFSVPLSYTWPTGSRAGNGELGRTWKGTVKRHYKTCLLSRTRQKSLKTLVHAASLPKIGPILLQYPAGAPIENRIDTSPISSRWANHFSATFFSVVP
jgi:hypothetical protein